MKVISSSLVAAAVLMTLAGSARAQLIAWGSPAYVTGDSNLVSNGTYFDAVNTAQSGFTSRNVDGTEFNALTFSGSTGSDGTISVNIGGGGTYVNGFSGGSTDYNYVVDHGADFAGGSVTLGSVSKPLTIGDTYQVEVWDYWNGGPYQAYVQGSPAETFAYPANQFAIGTFTATALTETFNVTGAPTSNGAGFLNDIVVREIPEPSTYAMMLIGLVAVGFCLRRKLA
jgi:hypothetical protein